MVHHSGTQKCDMVHHSGTQRCDRFITVVVRV